MFGYFRFFQRFATYEMKMAYKNYYCGVCFALEYNYGQKARMLLSYDVVTLGILGGVMHTNPTGKRLPCFMQKNKKLQFQNENWKRLAAINILLVNAKIDDDINDENSAKAKLAYSFFKSSIEKAKSDYPELSRIVNDGYKEMLKLEKKGNDVLEICDVFAELMVNLMDRAFGVPSLGLNITAKISRWLYFIDQLDDYDTDVEEGKINTLVIQGIDKSTFTNLYHEKLFYYLDCLLGEFSSIKKELDTSVLENRILYSILNETIPSITLQVIMDKKLPQIGHRNSRSGGL